MASQTTDYTQILFHNENIAPHVLPTIPILVCVNLENRRHQESPNSDMHPPNTPQTTVSPYKIISENTRLAELRLFPFVSINRLQTPTKLVLIAHFRLILIQIATCGGLRCCLAAAPAYGRQGQWPGTLREEKRCANGGLHSQQVHKVTAEAQRAPKMSTD